MKEDDPAAIETAMDLLQPRYKVPLVRGIIGNHIVRVLRSFKAVILRSPSGESFTTSDVPVCIDYCENFAWIIPAEAEIYLPLSLEYCLFLYNDKVPPSENPFRKLPLNHIHVLAMDDFLGIAAMLATNAHKKLLVPPQYRGRIETAIADGAFISRV